MLLNTPICNFDWQAPNFKLQDFNGNDHQMSDYLQANGLLIAFICNHCPYVIALAERLVSDMKELMDQGVGVLAVMSNDYTNMPSDTPENMKKFSQKYDFPFPYLVDHDQSVGKAYGAVCTPDFFGFNANAGLQYRGRLDSAAMGDPTGRTRELVDAMRQIAKSGQGPRHQVPSMGCSIKWSKPA